MRKTFSLLLGPSSCRNGLPGACRPLRCAGTAPTRDVRAPTRDVRRVSSFRRNVFGCLLAFAEWSKHRREPLAGGKGVGMMSSTNFGERFARFREAYRKPDGRRWTYVDVERATGGFIKANYLANLKAGRIRRPGIDRLCAISQVMGFPEELWLRKEGVEATAVEANETSERAGSLTARLYTLSQVLIDRGTGEPLTDKEVADLTFGELDEETIASARTGRVTELQGAQYVALANALGVDVSYWYARPGEPPPMNSGTVGTLKSEKAWTILHKLSGCSKQQQDLILALLDQLSGSGDHADRDSHPPKPMPVPLLIVSGSQVR